MIRVYKSIGQLHLSVQSIDFLIYISSKRVILFHWIINHSISSCLFLCMNFLNLAQNIIEYRGFAKHALILAAIVLAVQQYSSTAVQQYSSTAVFCPAVRPSLQRVPLATNSIVGTDNISLHKPTEIRKTLKGQDTKYIWEDCIDWDT